MPIEGPSLTVGQHTTLQEVQEFVSHVDKNARIHGRYDSQTGETTLYVGKKSPSLLALVTGKWAERRSAAKNAVTELVNRSIENVTGSRQLSERDRTALDNLTANIGSQRDALRGHSLRAGYLGVLAAAAKGAQAYGKDRVPDGGPTLAMLGNGSEAISLAARNLKVTMQFRGGESNDLAEAFGDKLAELYLAQNPGADARMLFATSTGDDFKAALLEAFKAEIGGEEGEEFAKSERVTAFLDAAFNRAASRMLPNSEVPGTSTPITWKNDKNNDVTANLPDIRIGDTVFKPVRHLGTGGFAEVYAYRATDGSNRMIAYKISKEQSPEAIREVGLEIRAHAAMSGQGHPNVIKLEGAIRSEDGRLGIAMELAPGTDALEFAKMLKAKVGDGPGQIPPKLAEIVRLTLLKDMIEGTRHLQVTQGGLHGDLKTPNVLIGNGGLAKVSDFGLSQQGTDFLLRDTPVPDNPIWLAPEVLSGQNDMTQIGELKKPMLKYVSSSVVEQITNVLPRESPYAVKALTNSIMQPSIREDQAKVGFTSKSDTWALGVMALDLWTGKMLLSNESFMSAVHRRVAAFMSSPDNMAIAPLNDDGTPMEGSLSGSTGNIALDTLVNNLLHPTASLRPELSEALDDPLFNQPGVGSDEVRALIVALSGGNDVEVDKAVNALGQRVGE